MSSRSSKKAKAEDRVFMVDKVLDKRIGKAGREEFLIQWLGFAPSDSSWEPRENLHCYDMLEAFEIAHGKKPSRRKHKSPEVERQPQTPKQPSTSESPRAPTTPTEEEPATKDPFSLNGKQLRCIVGLTKAPGDLHFLCKFSDDTARLLPAKEVNSRYPHQVIKYYESKLTVEDPKYSDL